MPTVLSFGKYSGRAIEGLVMKDPAYLVWAYENVKDSGITKHQYNTSKRRAKMYPSTTHTHSDATMSSAPEPEERITRHADGSGIRHCGGPCGDQYFDKFGNT